MSIFSVLSVPLICVLAAPVFSLTHTIFHVHGFLMCNAPLAYKAEISLFEHDLSSPNDLLRKVELESPLFSLPFNFTASDDGDELSKNFELFLRIVHNCNSKDDIQGKLEFTTDWIIVPENPKIQDVDFGGIDITNRG